MKIQKVLILLAVILSGCVSSFPEYVEKYDFIDKERQEIENFVANEISNDGIIFDHTIQLFSNVLLYDDTITENIPMLTNFKIYFYGNTDNRKCHFVAYVQKVKNMNMLAYKKLLCE